MQILMTQNDLNHCHISFIGRYIFLLDPHYCYAIICIIIESTERKPFRIESFDYCILLKLLKNQH